MHNLINNVIIYIILYQANLIQHIYILIMMNDKRPMFSCMAYYCGGMCRVCYDLTDLIMHDLYACNVRHACTNILDSFYSHNRYHLQSLVCTVH